MEQTRGPSVNNELYHALGERWYKAQDDPVALLRAEAAFRNPWIIQTTRNHLGDGPLHALDIACGGGFLTNAMAKQGFVVTGLDASRESLDVARRFDETNTVRYDFGDAYRLPYEAESFDVVSAMDFLEHVEEPERVVREAGRVLKPGGLFFFSTFNRNFLGWLFAVKGVEWFVKNTPPNLHVLRLFIKPSELEGWCRVAGMPVEHMLGLRPVLNSAFFKMLATRIVPVDFRFRFTNSLRTGYIGYAVKEK